MLTVRNVAQMTGISEHTLRAWEKRHRAIVPLRDSSGRRNYSLEEVKRVKLIFNLVQQGHKIGQLAPVKTSELENVWTSLYSHLTNATLIEKNNQENLDTSSLFLEKFISRTLDELSKYNIREMMNTIHQARLLSDARTFLLSFAAPLLVRMGHQVYEKKMEISHEHCLSAVLRHFLSDILYQQSRMSPSFMDSLKRKTIIFATPENEFHEFGIQISACLASLLEFNIFYLGCNVPVNSLLESVNSLGASIVVIGAIVTNTEQAKKNVKYLQKCRQKIDSSVQICLGGNLIRIAPKSIKNLKDRSLNFKYIENFLDFELFLQTIHI